MGCAEPGEAQRPPTAAPSPGQLADTDQATPTRTAPGLPTAQEWQRARSLTHRMTLRQLAGQVIVVAWTGDRSPVEQVRRLHFGGVITLPGGRVSPTRAAEVNQEVRRSFGQRGYPPFLAVDQEGGRVVRVGTPVPQLPSLMAAGAVDRPRLTRLAAYESASGLRRAGFTVVLAPVADLTVGPRDPVIGTRSAGSTPSLAIPHVIAAGEGIRRAGLVPVVKHFPGHGSVAADSHHRLPVQRASLKRLQRRDLAPFRAAIEAGFPAIMTGHLAVRAVEPEQPATTSRRVITGLLREEMKFSGLVVTDALNMAGVQRAHPGATAAVRALDAGADVVLMPPNPRMARDRIVKAVRRGWLSQSRLQDAATTMIATLMHARPTRLAGGKGAADRLARGAITSLAGPCRGPLVGDRVRIAGSDWVSVHMSVELARRGVDVVPRPDRKQRLRRWRAVPLISLDGYGSALRRRAAVAVALDRPWPLGRVKARVKVATFGATEASLRALADVLTGRAQARGRLPVHVAGGERHGCH